MNETLSQDIPKHTQVVILGGGPAAVAIGASLVDQGVEVIAIWPHGPTPWPNTYGVWEDELEPWAKATSAHRWERPAVAFERDWQSLDRVYVRLDNALLREALLAQGAAYSVDGVVTAIAHTPTGSRVTWQPPHEPSASHTIHAKLVIDASGHKSPFVHKTHTRAPSIQTAYGVKLSASSFAKSSWTMPPGGMALMDYRGPQRGQVATFLYAMELEGGQVFLEETAMSARPMMTREELERRLELRLGFRPEPDELLEQEWCWIPMGAALPSLDQRLLAYGGAASMVHPASGYQLARVLSWRHEVAQVIARGLRRSDHPSKIARAYWETLWSQDRQRQHALYLFGLEALLKMSPKALTSFFETFFMQPQWGDYLSGRLSSAQLSAMMLQIFGSSDAKMRLLLIRPALSVHAQELIRAAHPKAFNALKRRLSN